MRAASLQFAISFANFWPPLLLLLLLQPESAAAQQAVKLEWWHYLIIGAAVLLLIVAIAVSCYCKKCRGSDTAGGAADASDFANDGSRPRGIRVGNAVKRLDGRQRKGCSPFSRQSKLIIQMSGNQTCITDPSSGQDKKFAFDYSYWSHDGFKEKTNGYLEPANSKYADQKRVFDDLGRGVLDNAWKGYNCSLFAYGQTGSGKSYSMIGYGANKGIVPVACEELFRAIDEKRPSLQAGEEFQVSLSMTEIYNEQVRDLLVTKSTVGGLKVRQHPKKGFYVEQLTIAPVSSYAQIEAKIADGSHNRTVAATNMNATSSRAHTIVAISFVQKSQGAGGQNMTKTSVMNLVDLAGSERAESTGATGDRLKEGSAINLSLSTLGNCIKALADQSSGNSKVMVPFRDSVLTKLLQNALGGNSKTVMIAALSPADINFDETLSTLRFADRAKAIKTKAVVNESPTDKLIRELREENSRLMAMLKAGGGGGGDITDGGGDTGEDQAESEERMRELMKKNQEEMEAMERAWAEKLAQAQAEAQEQIQERKAESERKKNVPHLWNLNEDAALSGMIVQFVDPGAVQTVGRDGDFQLKGVNIQARHAVLKNVNGSVTVTPIDLAKVFVNGQEVNQETQLRHHDRVLFGTNHLYVFHHPVDYAKQVKSGQDVSPPTFEEAQSEIAESSGVMGLLGDKAKSNSAEDMLLMDDLVKLYPQLQEANAMSEEMDRRVWFELVLVSAQGRGLREGEGRTEVCVSVQNLDNNNEFFWSKEKFSDRKYLMQDMYQNYTEGADWELAKEKDPFWDPPDTPIIIGTIHVYLQSLAYLIEVSESFNVTDFRGEDQGKLDIELRPCGDNWEELTDEYAEPEDLLGQALNFKIKIHGGRDLSAKFASYFCQYKFYLEDQYTKTGEVAKPVNPRFEFEHQYSFKPATKQLLEYLQHSYTIVELWGKQRCSDKKVNKSTKELIKEKRKAQAESAKALGAQKKSISKQATGEDVATLRAELDSLKKRNERSEAKLKQLQAMVNDAKKQGNETIEVDNLDKVLSAPAPGGGQGRMKLRQAALAMSAVYSGFGAAPEVAEKRKAALGKNASSTCSVQ
uniref:Kinesin-like protein 6 n=1 Tax=Macrostomum lignano TaxID=282301 RepID=A0A1I8IKH8_9PLAT